MLIKVLKTKDAASCKLGISSMKYFEGKTYDIFDELADIFIKQGWGIEQKIEEKSIEESPENKMFSGNLENKQINKKRRK